MTQRRDHSTTTTQGSHLVQLRALQLLERQHVPQRGHDAFGFLRRFGGFQNELRLFGLDLCRHSGTVMVLALSSVHRISSRPHHILSPRPNASHPIPSRKSSGNDSRKMCRWVSQELTVKYERILAYQSLKHILAYLSFTHVCGFPFPRIQTVVGDFAVHTHHAL